MSFSLGQGVVESEPNCYPRLPVVCRLYCKKNGLSNCPTKKVDISHGNFDVFAY